MLWKKVARGRRIKRTKALAILKRVIKKNHTEEVRNQNQKSKSKEGKCMRKRHGSEAGAREKSLRLEYNLHM